MAYDKVIDSAQLETALTTMANAIREKTGETTSLEWVANKGFADIISGIESGGDSKIIFGTFTPIEDGNIVIENAFPYSSPALAFGVFQDFSTLNSRDDTHTENDLVNQFLINTPNNTTQNRHYFLVLSAYKKPNTSTITMLSDNYPYFKDTIRTGNSLYECMQPLIDGETKNLYFGRSDSGNKYFLMGRTYHYFMIFGDDAI